MMGAHRRCTAPMAAIEDRAYSTACSQLASMFSISMGAARRRVEMKAAQHGLRDAAAKTALALELLEQARSQAEPHGRLLDELLEAVASEMNFMDED